MIRALLAPVRPRVIAPETGDPITLEEMIRSLIESTFRGAVEILGDHGTGKTTALEHLVATLALPVLLVLRYDHWLSQWHPTRQFQMKRAPCEYVTD